MTKTFKTRSGHTATVIAFDPANEPSVTVMVDFGNGEYRDSFMVFSHGAYNQNGEESDNDIIDLDVTSTDKPFVAWGALDDSITHIAQSKTGVVMGYTTEPVLNMDRGEWTVPRGHKKFVLTMLKGTRRGNCVWTDSMVGR